MAYLLGFAIGLALVLSSMSIWKYGNVPRQHPLVTLSVFTAWSFSFLIVFSIPLDITSVSVYVRRFSASPSFIIFIIISSIKPQTVYRQCVHDHNTTRFLVPPEQVAVMRNSAIVNLTASAASATLALAGVSSTTTTTAAPTFDECRPPWGMIPEHVFTRLWRIIYWSSQLLTWLIMPLMQSYLKAGEFTFKGKLRSALIDNAIYYGSYLTICGVLLVYIALKPDVYLDWPKLKAIASSASNTWGLFLLVLLLGYALVEVPRSLWNNAKQGFTLQYAYFKSAKLSTEKAEAEEHVDDVLESLHAASRATPTNHERRAYVETILRKVPVELMERVARMGGARGALSGGGGGDMSTTIIPSEKALVRLHKSVIKSLQTLQRSEALWAVQVNKVLQLEDVARNMGSMDKRFRAEFGQQQQQQRRGAAAVWRMVYSPRVEWYWQCCVRPPFLKCLAVVTGTLSAMVVWSELTFFNQTPVLSIFARILNVAKYNYDYMTIEVCSMCVLCYLCYCAYSTIFRIKFLNLYYLAPHHQTNEHSLIFSGMLLCRLTPPMCLNFLGMVHMDSHVIKGRIFETQYTQVMGHMDVIGIIADGFNIYFPMVMLAFCLATWFSVGSRTLNALGFQQFMLNETIATELVQEGRDLIAREKRRRQRAEEAAIRRNNNAALANKYRGTTATAAAATGAMADHSPLGPNDGLLRDGDAQLAYSTVDRDIHRTLSQEINERFGTSTHLQVGFGGGGSGVGGFDAGDSDSDEAVGVPRFGRQTRPGGQPPRGLFDDV